ncbi:MAG: pyridoxamine 5'-phosphate oxidase family protein [Dehalococcoidia bacterium]
MDERIQTFLKDNSAASMITPRRDGSAHAVRVGVALVDGKIWSSGTQSRARTKHLRRDRRATLFVFEPAGWRWLSLESVVTVLDGPDAPDLNIKLFEVMQGALPQQPRPRHLMWFGQEKTIDEFREAMIEEQRLIYEFEIQRAYGMY